ncbi:MAG TPA: glutathione peroxidase [Dongiaceae bacterium]|jgi:glutathione peroxidase|nr:glutathione peroxidase [Dongiaceae bacterium]
MTAHDFSFPAIDGDTLRLADFKGKPVLIVNTASECGYTPQYADLEQLWRKYRDRGLVVLGVPSNDFGRQEPGDEAEIMSFCTTSYGVDFPMTAKQAVIGGAAHPFYRWVVAEFGEAAAPKWNFHKYLVAPDGSLAALWPSSVKPLDPEITAAIEEQLVK